MLGVVEFRAIFVANIVSMLGSVVAAVALTVLVYQQTRSPALAASVMALSFLPYLIGGALLGAAEFRAVFAANLVSMLGSVVAAVALTVLVYQQTRSPALAASVMALSFVPYLVGGVLLGAAVDRLPPRTVLVACDLASAALIGCMVIPGTPLPALLVLLFAAGLLSPVYQGARAAMLPELLPSGPPSEYTR